MTDLERMTRDRDGWCLLALMLLCLLIAAAYTFASTHRCIPQPCVQPKADDPWQVPGSPADLPEGM